jgi:hypothetical protein
MDRGVVLSEVGRFDLEEIEVDAPGDDEVLVRIEASGVCHSDLHVVETGWAHRCRSCWATKEPASWKRSAVASRRLRREIAWYSGGDRRAVPAAGARGATSAAVALLRE